MTKRILILLFSVMLIGMSEYVEFDCRDDDPADVDYTARGGEYGHGKKFPPPGVYVDGDTDGCMSMDSLDALDPVDQESAEE